MLYIKYGLMMSYWGNISFYPFRLFEGSSPRKIEKLKTLLCYFTRVAEKSKFETPAIFVRLNVF